MGAGIGHLIGSHSMQEVARIENLQQEFVSLFSILPHQRGEVLHGWGLYLLETIECIYLPDSVKDIVTLGHLHRRKITCPLRDGRLTAIC